MSQNYFFGEPIGVQEERKYNESFDKYCSYQKTESRNKSSQIINEMDNELTEVLGIIHSEVSANTNLTGEDILIQLVLSDKITTSDIRKFSTKLDGEYSWLEFTPTKN